MELDMRAVVQRVTSSTVTVDNELIGSIGKGINILIGISNEDDIEDLYRIYEGDTITKYMEGLYEDREKERQFIRSYIENAYEFYGFGTWVIERKEDSRLIGRVGFNMREGYEEPELGFVIAEEFQRQGYAFECCRAVMEVGKKEYDFDRIQTLVQIQNEASLELCKKLGFIWVEEIEYENKAYCRWIKYL